MGNFKHKQNRTNSIMNIHMHVSQSWQLALIASLVLSVSNLFCLPSPSDYFEVNPRCRINSVCIMSVCISIKDMSSNSPFSWRLSFHICFLGICLLKHLFVLWRFQVWILLFQTGGVVWCIPLSLKSLADLQVNLEPAQIQGFCFSF